jgi:phosphatidylinositol phosphate synthase
MLNKFARAFATRLFTPVAKALLAAGVSPDVVTVIGTIGVCAGALFFYPRHDFLVGTLVVIAFVFSDTIDGTMAQLSGRTTSWGAFLDSTLDRFGDGAVFGGLLLYFASVPDGALSAWFALACLVFAFVTSYARSRAESLGVTEANVGIAERADRLVVVLAATGLTGLFGWSDTVVTVVLGLLAVASAVTVVQRMLAVHRALARTGS